MIVRNLAYFTEQSLTPGMFPSADLSRTCVIPQLLIEAAQFFQESGMSRGISIELEDPRTQYAIAGSLELIRQVFMNILDNAVKYSDADSKVSITTRIQKKTDDLIVEICNVGPGFSHEEAKAIFNPGVRARRLAISSRPELGSASTFAKWSSRSTTRPGSRQSIPRRQGLLPFGSGFPDGGSCERPSQKRRYNPACRRRAL